jgi:malonate-semialdehyde dehydrogenase (acetylating) / methylmalonate-semialdehyde dehydrogenase
MAHETELLNYVGGAWQRSHARDHVHVTNPATGVALADVPLSPAQEVDAAVRAAAAAWPAWRRVPPLERIQYLFKLKQRLEDALPMLARTITEECGKTLAEAEGEIRRGIENVEVATGVPTTMMGVISEDIASGVDELMIRQPIGVVAIITPFNFPGMIPLWFLPYALATGNTVVMKPSEKTPRTMAAVMLIIDELKLPKGVVNLVHGGREASEALCDHPDVRAVSFVGSTAVARAVYARATAAGKRAQCQGGAKNPIIILPDADMDMTTRIAADSAFGCAGQRCLAASVAITVGEARDLFTPRITEVAAGRKVGNGLEPGIEMGPVISEESRARIGSLIDAGLRDGARALVDGRSLSVKGGEHGHFVGPTVLENVRPGTHLAKTEVFGPVLSLMHVKTIEEAIDYVNSQAYGNMACLFTQSGNAARRFRYEAEVGNVGINVGVAAPMAFFPFSGWKESFFGDLHAQGSDAIDFYTHKKVVVERWPAEWTRKF